MAATVADLQVKVSADTSGAEKGLKTVQNETEKSGGLFSKLTSGVGGFVAAGLATAGVGLSIGAIGGYLTGAVQGAMDMENAQVSLNRVLSSGSHIVGLTADAVNNLADNLSKQTGVDDDVIRSAETMIAGFRNISQKEFPDVTKAALDLAQATGTDATSAAQTLGRALNDPTKAAKLFKEANITLTDSQQKALDAALKHNDVAKAQAVIMDAVKAKVGGAADAFAGTNAGKIQAFQTAMGNIQKTVGAALLPILTKLMDKLLPLAQALADNLPGAIAVAQGAFDKIGGVLQFFSDNADTVKAVLGGLAVGIAAVTVPILVGLVPAFIAWAVAAGAAAVATIIAAAPVVAIVLGIALLVAGIILLVQHWKQVTDFIHTAWVAGVAVVQRTIASILSWFGDLPGKVGGFISGMVTNVLSFFGRLKDLGIQVIMAAINLWLDIYIRFPIRVISIIVQFVANLIATFINMEARVLAVIGGFVSNIIGFFASLPGKMLDMGKRIIQGLIDGIRSMAGAVGGALSSVMGGIHIPGFAAGGDAPGGLAVVGEHGPELVALPAGAHVYPNGTGPRTVSAGGGSAGGAGRPLQVQINIAGHHVADAIMPDVVAELRRSNATRR